MSIIKSARKHLGLSQSQMAGYIKARTGGRCTPKQVSDWECGQKQPRQHVRDAVENCAAQALLRELNNTPPSNHEQLVTEMMR